MTTDSPGNVEAADIAAEAGSNSGSDSSPDGFPDSVGAVADVGAGLFSLEVENGYGSGWYPAGSEIHVWAALAPMTERLITWDGDVELLASRDEWHTTFVMPSHPVVLRAQVEARTDEFVTVPFVGSTQAAKTIRHALGPDPVGLVFFLHGTGGSSAMIDNPEVRYLAASSIARGYAVVVPESEETAQGDLNRDGKIRWDASLTTDNVDFANLNSLIEWARDQGYIEAETPLFAVGMSNGGATSLALGAVSASDVAGAYPALRFQAVVSYCAGGRATAAAITTTPTAWFLCANDDNEAVSNEEAAENSATLAERGVATLLDAHPASPLYPERFARVPGITPEASAGFASELIAAGFLDDGRFFTTPSDDIVSAIDSDPGAFPLLGALPGGKAADVRDQIRVMQAEHELYSDWSERTVDFLDTHRSP